eukprot:Awhi_evm1s3644
MGVKNKNSEASIFLVIDFTCPFSFITFKSIYKVLYEDEVENKNTNKCNTFPGSNLLSSRTFSSPPPHSTTSLTDSSSTSLHSTSWSSFQHPPLTSTSFIPTCSSAPYSTSFSTQPLARNSHLLKARSRINILHYLNDVTIPLTNGLDLGLYLKNKYKTDYIPQLFDKSSPIHKLGQENQINFNDNRKMVNSLHAHRLLKFAMQKLNMDKVMELVFLIFRRYFELATDISNVKNLVLIAEECGLNKDETTNYLLNDKNSLLYVLTESDYAKKSMNIRKTPTLIIKNKKDLALCNNDGLSSKSHKDGVIIEGLVSELTFRTWLFEYFNDVSQPSSNTNNRKSVNGQIKKTTIRRNLSESRNFKNCNWIKQQTRSTTSAMDFSEFSNVLDDLVYPETTKNKMESAVIDIDKK